MGNEQPTFNSISSNSFKELPTKQKFEKVFQKTDLVSTLKSYSEIKKIFEQYDTDKNGFIDRKEYQSFVKDVAERNHIEESILNGLAQSFDTDKDGNISYEEFISLISRLNPQKILLLGPGGGGKSTFFKQFQNYEKNPKYPISRGMFLFVFFTYLFSLAKECKDDPEVLKLYKALDEHKILNSSTGDWHYLQEEFIGNTLKKLWENDTIQKFYKERLDNYEVPEFFTYIIQTKKDIFSKSFIPSQEDAIYISTKTTGVIEHKTIINHVHFEIFDTGGQASERKKWPQLFKKANCVVYITTLSNFDETCYEDLITNRMMDSLNLFNQLVNDPELIEKPFVVIFNKMDLFKTKIQEKKKYQEMLQLFPDYQDGHDEQKIIDYITSQFLNLHHSPKEITFYYSNATELESVRSIFDDIFGFKYLEKKGLVDPKEKILLNSKFISQLNTFDSIKELFNKYDLDKSGLLEEDEWKNFLDGISKESETLTQEILDSLKPMMDLDKDGKVNFREFVSFTSKVKTPSFLLCGAPFSGKSLLLKHFKLFEKSFNDKNRVKHLMYENLHAMMVNIVFECGFNTEHQSYEKFDEMNERINPCPDLLNRYQSFMIRNRYFDIYKNILNDDDIKERLKTYTYKYVDAKYFLNRMDDLSKSDFEPTLEDYFHVNEKDNEKKVYHRNVLGNINFKIYSMDEDFFKWKNYSSNVDYVCFVAPVTDFDSLKLFQSVLNEVEFIDKQIIIFFSKIDEFERLSSTKKFIKNFSKQFEGFKEEATFKNMLKYIKQQYLELTEYSLRKKVSHFDCDMFNQKYMSEMIEKIFNLN